MPDTDLQAARQRAEAAGGYVDDLDDIRERGAADMMAALARDVIALATECERLRKIETAAKVVVTLGSTGAHCDRRYWDALDFLRALGNCAVESSAQEAGE